MVREAPESDPFQNCVTLETFESQMAWLSRRGYHCIPLSCLASRLYGGASEVLLPRRAFVITFDDGYEDTYTNAWPTFAGRYGFTATVFLVSNAIGGYNDFDSGYVSEQLRMLSAPQIREMASQSIDFGSHSRSHPATLTGLPDERLRDELVSSRKAIEDVCGGSVLDFAYPHSKLDARIEAAVEESGYRLACSGAGSRFDAFCLHRVDGALAGPGSGIELAIWRRRLKWLVRARLLSRGSAAGNG